MSLQVVIGRCENATCTEVQPMGVLPGTIEEVLSFMGKPCRSCGCEKLRIADWEDLIYKWRQLLDGARGGGYEVSKEIDQILLLIKERRAREVADG